MLPISTDSPVQRTPWVNWLLIALNIAVMLLETSNPALVPRHQLDARSTDLWGFLTYAFLHVGWGHLLANMLVLQVLGSNVNDRLGHAGYLAFYLGGAVFAGIGFLATGGQATVGASGAVGAVMGAFLAMLPQAHILVNVVYGWLEVPCTYFVIIYFVYNLIMSLSSQSEVQQVAYEAHIAGMLFGFIVGLALLASRLAPRQPFDLLGILGRWNRRRHYRQLVREGFDPFAYAAPPDARPREVDHAAVEVLRHRIARSLDHRDVPGAVLLYRQLKELDPGQVLPRDAQLEIANQLASDQHYHDAAEAYEQYMEHYPTSQRIGDVQLMLGLIYARYLGRHGRARECLQASLPRLGEESALRLAREELDRLAREETAPPPPDPGATDRPPS